MGQDQVIKTFFVTLRRSQAGKPYFHRRVLDALGLTKRLACVEKPNSPVIRGMLRKVGQQLLLSDVVHLWPQWLLCNKVPAALPTAACHMCLQCILPAVRCG